MSEPTPGPWEVYHDGYHDTWSVEGGGDIVCDLWRLAEETHNRHPHFEDNCEANARLIANAPEMYAMLKSSEFRFDDRYADFYCDWCHNTATQGHRETCRLAVILKGTP